jgi:hypothetical protein
MVSMRWFDAWDLLVVVGGRILAERKITGSQVGSELTSMSAFDVDDLILRGIARRDGRESDSFAIVDEFTTGDKQRA